MDQPTYTDLHILLTSAEIGFRRLVRSMIKNLPDLPAHITECRSLTAAHKHLGNGRFDVLITTWLTGNDGGNGILSFLKQRHVHIPIIIMTTAATPAMMRQLRYEADVDVLLLPTATANLHRRLLRVRRLTTPEIDPLSQVRLLLKQEYERLQKTYSARSPHENV